MSGIWWFPVILAQQQSQAACLIIFSKMSYFDQPHPSKGPVWLYGLEEASDRRLTCEQRPRLSIRAEQEDVWRVYDAVGFW